ncbi:adaptin ear-binding coat-associated protein 1 NECAP-1 [Mytilinidion resinicola]|uniref:Adaptin ear-binding coat-associated protein 1 NECAP-1 n=1 Tax=Mytilinidion resinicola TaxID=574789 RepID=A0A6A6YX00_9PEZI|nr:adaptin ear-binding coat-associated protein 1 NECAP-1 [Mytilinidion resinicola]KAF2813049.1 adaptin ear-binding coat-associated protein 1 NECAP-1 [Mytilinidion resinicola]
MNTDPTTNTPLPADAIQRILFIAPKVHVYNIPPLTSTTGYKAAAWTENNNARQIFTARLRILEIAIPLPSASPATAEPQEKVTTTLLLEDPATGALFAACPYTSPATVSQAIDSSRFFALVVVGDGGRKATLGIGFEERSEAFDFSISLQDARRVLGMENPGAAATPGGKGGKKGRKEEGGEGEKRDFSLKEGETITVNIGGRGRRAGGGGSGTGAGSEQGGEEREKEALFSIKPPPGSGSAGGLGGGGGGGGMPFLPPPPSAREVKEERRRSRQAAEMTPKDLGFDDGEFGEFQ